MKNHQKVSTLLRHDGRWNALQKLDEAVERNTTGGSNAEIIRLMRKFYFDDVDELENSGEVKLPD
jgi:hypothetical protein